MSPTQRSLAELKRSGFLCQVVEKWNPHARVRQDLFGIIDILAITPAGLLGIQATSGTNHSARRAKALAEPRLAAWLAAGGRFEVWSWAKRGARGERKQWALRREEVRPADMCAGEKPDEVSIPAA